MIIYITSKGTQYKITDISPDKGITYSINSYTKNIPINTIIKAYTDKQKGLSINRKWYNDYNKKESTSRPCNLSMLNTILNKLINLS